MKRLDLVQLTIIIVGLFSGYFFITSVPQFLYYLYAWFNEGLRGGGYMDTLIWNIIISGSYLLAAIYCIKKSKHFAKWICSNENLNAEINFALHKSELLFILFIGLGIYGIITRLPAFMVDSFIYIKSKNNAELFAGTKAVTPTNLVIQLMTLLLFFILVYYAKVFADFFSAKINNVESEDETQNKSFE